MKRFLFVLLSCICCACSSADVVEPTAEQAQTTTTFTAQNQSFQFSQPNGTICHPTLLGGTDASSQAPVFKWGVFGYGGIAGVEPSGFSNGNALFNIFAVPNQAHQPPQAGNMSAIAKCDLLSAFNGVQPAASPNYILSWSQTGTTTAVSGSVDMWTTGSICWINSVGGMSNTGETVELTTPGGTFWRLNVSGFASLSGSAQCAYLGRAPNYQWLHATPGNPAYGLFPAQGACFVHKIVGVVDNGNVRLHTGTLFGNYALEIDGAVGSADGYCIAF